MRDITVVAIIYSMLFIVLTTTVTTPMAGMSVPTLEKLHFVMAELIFWGGTLYICASGTYGAFVRQDRFALSHKHPLLNRSLSLLLLLSPFLAVFFNVRFVYAMLGLLLFSHLRSKTEDEKTVEFPQSRTFSNMVLLVLFTLALMLMNNNDYYVTSILDFGSTNTQTTEAISSDA